ncbi:hypothetical protein OCE25_26240 [Bacillus cereus]|nr:hypothetical protein [Bacillus cereus]
MFKKLGIIGFSTLVLGGALPIVSHAAENEGVVKTNSAIYDYRMIEEKSTVKESLNSLGNMTKAAPTNTSQVKRFLVPPLISATATSNSSVKEDYISATVRAYNDSGGLWGTKSDSATKSSYAGATYDSGVKYIKFAYGSHVYKLAGYKDVVHETYAG